MSVLARRESRSAKVYVFARRPLMAMSFLNMDQCSIWGGQHAFLMQPDRSTIWDVSNRETWDDSPRDERLGSKLCRSNWRQRPLGLHQPLHDLLVACIIIRNSGRCMTPEYVMFQQATRPGCFRQFLLSRISPRDWPVGQKSSYDSTCCNAATLQCGISVAPRGPRTPWGASRAYSRRQTAVSFAVRSCSNEASTMSKSRQRWLGLQPLEQMAG